MPEPLVDLKTFARREMAATNVTTLIMGFSMFSTFILLPNFVQVPLGLPDEIADQLNYGFGASPVEVGLFFIPSSIAMIIAGPLAGVLGQRYGRILPLRIGLASLVLALDPARDDARAVLDDLRLDDLHGRRPGVLLRHARHAGDRLLARRARPASPAA